MKAQRKVSGKLVAEALDALFEKAAKPEPKPELKHTPPTLEQSLKMGMQWMLENRAIPKDRLVDAYLALRG